MVRLSTFRFALSLLIFLSGLAGSLSAASPAEIRYNRDIRPLLSDNCFRCHGPDKNQRKGKLRLDDRAIAVERKAIVPGKPEESELVRRIYAADPDDIMPPGETHKELSSAQKALLKGWIAQGAQYEPHWAYIRPVRAPIPAVKNQAWIQNPIDAFILAGLERHGVAASRPAEKRTLLRRLSLDLTGLPPGPASVERFLRDPSTGAYEHEVDRLLDSVHFGERMAVGWLDVVRFSDTVGYHGDQNQNIFPYRDYVINSFNRNKPFDQFTMEQLAGDLLPQPTTEQRVATGFNRLNMMTREGGAQPNEYLAKYAGDRVRTVAATWLGSTLGCAECHDHKFDPFTAKDFYQMGAFFADVKQWGVYSDYNYTPNSDLKGWSNDHPFPPEIEVVSPALVQRERYFRGRLAQLNDLVGKSLAAATSERQAFAAWREKALSFLSMYPRGWESPVAAASPSKNTNATAQTAEALADGSLRLTGKPENLQVRLPLSEGWLAAIRVELIPDPKHSNSIVRGDAKNTTVTLGATLETGEGKPVKLSFYDADADYKEERYADGSAILGVRDAWRTSPAQGGETQTGVWLVDPPQRIVADAVLVVNLGNTAAGRVRVSVSPFSSGQPLRPFAAVSRRPAWAKLTVAERKAWEDLYFASTGWEKEAFADFKKFYREIAECRGGRAWSMVTEARTPIPARVLPRGNWQDESGEVVQPAPPHFLVAGTGTEGRRQTRLDLARWLVAPENPLTARTIVNRWWKQFFGAGLSNPVDDLGLQGEPPSHPELLDWLAVEFQESGWNIKHLVKLMVMSAAYRQDSTVRPELKEADPNNRWLAAQSPRRLEAEFVRDNALWAAGLLNPDVGGPSARPYQPPNYYVNLQFPDRDYYAHRDERQYRRGLYSHWQRTFLHPMLANFDAPSREECTASRVVSNTPQQALTLLNDPTFVEAARVFAQNLLLGAPPRDEDRVDFAFQRVLARPARFNEKASLLRLLESQRAHYRQDTEESRKLAHAGLAASPAQLDAGEVASWMSICRVILNLHESITIY
jgi:hypothetical protein